MGDETTGPRRIVAGRTQAEAAGSFGALFDDVLVTTYEDFDNEVGVGTLELLALADGAGVEPVLEQRLADALPERLLVEVPRTPERRAWLAALLADHPEIGVLGSESIRTGVAIVLGPATATSVSGPAAAVLIDAVPQVPASVPALWPADGDAPRTDGRKPVPVQPRKQVRAAPRRRLGRRALQLLLVAGGLAVVAAVVLIAIGTSGLGADGVLVTLLLGVALVQAAVLVAVAYLVRGSRRHQVDLADMSTRVAATRRRQDALGRGLAGLRQGQQREVAHHHYVVELGRRLERQLSNLENASKRRHLMTERQAQALLNLRDLVEVRGAVPPMGGWAASPDLLVYCVDTMLTIRPQVVVECGSGISTLYLALAAEQHGLDTRIVALEHQAQYAEATRALLEHHGVAHRAEIRLAPLQPTSLTDHETPWYAEDALAGLTDIGMLLVDGPPTATGPGARYPAVPLLADRLAPRCVIVMDDLIRASDHETAEAWAGYLPDFELSVINEFDKHVGILRRG